VSDQALIGWVLSSLLLSLRIAPVFALAPPFSLVRMPAVFRVLFGVGIAACLVAAYPEAARVDGLSAGAFMVTAVRELFLGSILVLAFQLPFGAIYLAGRTIDVQAGFGFAGLIDPSTQNQSPLAGTLLAYAAGIIFFAMDGHHELLRIIGASLDSIPLGSARAPSSLAPLFGFVSAAFLTGLGVGGFMILALFLVDLSVTMLSRTAPQMNVLVLGFQAKTLVFLLAFPITLGVSAAVLARLLRQTLEALPRLM
jgi:flagellar biosynthesis protein FliR